MGENVLFLVLERDEGRAPVQTLSCPNLGPSGPPGLRERPPAAGPTLGMTNLPVPGRTGA